MEKFAAMKFAADGDNSYLALSRHYDACLRRHGDTAQGADWPNEADRRTRFSVMLDILAGGSFVAGIECTPEAKPGPNLAITGNMILTAVRTETYLSLKAKVKAGNS